MSLSTPEYLQAFLRKDAQFDGRFVAGVTTTGIYCKSSCSAKKPAPEHVVCFGMPAEAEAAGYRPCRKCRPDATPGTPAWNGTSAVVSRALRLIEDGLLDHANIDALCERLGIGARQLRRLFNKHLGTSPVQVARIRRAHFARRLVESTSMSMTHVAQAAGFGSVRRFNSVINEVYGCPPTALRRSPNNVAGGLDLQVPIEGPFPWARMLQFLEPWTVPGVEQIVGDRYYRTASFGKVAGEICVTHEPDAGALRVRVSSSLSAHLLDVVSGVRRLFDVDAQTSVIAEQLATDPVLDACLQVTPGLRVLGAFDHFETAVMMLLNQHIRPDEASELMDRIVDKYGKPVDTSQPSLTHVFPTPHALSTAHLEAVGVAKRRSRSIQALAKAVHEGALRLDGAPSLDAAVEGLRSIVDLSVTTAEYIAMRVYREPDAFPSNSRWLRKAISNNGAPVSVSELESHADGWRPWRAYAAMHLWDSFFADEPDGQRLWNRASAPLLADQVA
ncbi:MAG: helix-turn-helix domain-containing protein [Deltaproteobacteria bacterium]|nr:helix-turn-helix domain-containing protein [Deltaproteobacteria bacterium]